jgi:hypothetical protein
MRSILITILLIFSYSSQAAIIEIATHDEGHANNGPGDYCIPESYWVDPNNIPDGDPIACGPGMVFWRDGVSIGGSSRNSDMGNQWWTSSYHAFDLSGVEGYVESASFRIWLGAGGYMHEERPILDEFFGADRETVIRTDDNPYFLNSFDYIEPILAWKNGGTDPFTDYTGSAWEMAYALEDAYDALSGNQFGSSSYGSVLIDEDDEGSWIVVDLNSAALQDINNSLGGKFGVLGANPMPWGCTSGYACYDFMFNSPDSGNAVLTLNVTAVPIPAAVWLFASALGGLGWMRRRSLSD